VTSSNFSLALLSDTQFYAEYDELTPILSKTNQWIVDHKEDFNLKAVLHEGDLVQHNVHPDWKRAIQGMQPLHGKLPVYYTLGNHDLGSTGEIAVDRHTHFNDYFNLEDNHLATPQLGGLLNDGELQNAYYTFEENGEKFMVMCLEFGPRDSVVSWALGIAKSHPDHHIILLTHDFIDHRSTLLSEDGRPERSVPDTPNSPHLYGIAEEPDQPNCGEELWEKLVSQTPNFILVCNGHYKRFEEYNGRYVGLLEGMVHTFRYDTTPHGNTVNQMCFNAQWCPQGGDGWFRLLTFDTSVRQIQVRTISPYRKGFDGFDELEDEENQFTIQY